MTLEENPTVIAAEEYTALEDLPTFDVQVVDEGGKGGDDDNKRDWNRFVFEQAAFQQENPLAIISMGKITDPLEKALMAILSECFLLEWEGPNTNREAHYNREVEHAKGWRADMASEAAENVECPACKEPLKSKGKWCGACGEELPDDLEVPIQVEDLLKQWHVAASFMLQVKIQKRRHGLPRVEKHREKYMEARNEIDQVMLEASSLPPAHNQYFHCMVRAYQITLDRSYDQAMNIPIIDYTDMKAQIRKGVSIHKLVTGFPWSYRIMHARVFGSMSDGNTMRDHLAALFTGHYRMRDDEDEETGGGRGLMGWGQRDGDGEEEEEDDRGGRSKGGGRRSIVGRMRRGRGRD